MVHAVNVEMRLRSVRIAERIMDMPAQKATEVCLSSNKAWRTSVVTPAELKRTPSSILSKRDMNTILEAYR
jgi:hypothetical protein